MLVFRCECDHVLGIESESARGQPGECPACGRIIRVPDTPINAKGRLKLASAPSRATPSGAFRQIKDTKMDDFETRPKAGSSNGAIKAAPSPVPPTPPPTFDASKLSEEPETLAPLTEDEATDASAETMITEPEEQTEIPAVPERKTEVPRKPPSKAPRVSPETQVNKGAVTSIGAASSSSKRRRMDAEATAAAPAAKKSPVVLITIIAALLLAIAAVLYASGFFNKPPATDNNSTPPKTQTDNEKKADANKKPDDTAKPPAPDEKKKEDNKDNK